MKNQATLIIILGTMFLMNSSAPAAAQSPWSPGDFGSVRFSVGLFQPRADSSYWDQKFDVWTGDSEDFQDIAWNVDGLWMFSPTMGLQFGTSWFSGATSQSYRDWTDANGWDVAHSTQLETWDLSASWIFKPWPGNAVRPYFGLGGGLTSWRLEEYGDFIDFGDPGPPPIVTTGYGDSGTTFMATISIGLEIYTRGQVSFFLEGRFKQAETSLGGDFGSLSQRLDLSGGELAAGIAFNF